MYFNTYVFLQHNTLSKTETTLHNVNFWFYFKAIFFIKIKIDKIIYMKIKLYSWYVYQLGDNQD